MYIFLREVVSEQLMNNPIQLGGPGVIVEIDESLFRHKPKYHRGRYPVEDSWVFGMVDRSTSPAIGVMEIVPDRTATTLLAVLRRHVLPGSTVRSDMWRAYGGISSMGMSYIHETVNHSRHFVDPITGVHTQGIESYWAQTKLKFKTMKGVRRTQLPGYLDEKMWRDLYASDVFHNICLHINNIYDFSPSTPSPSISPSTPSAPISPSTPSPPISPSTPSSIPPYPTPPPPLSPSTPIYISPSTPSSIPPYPTPPPPLSPSTPSPQQSISTPPPIPTSPKVYSEREVENMLRNRQYLMINPYIDYGPFVDGLINDMS